MSLYWLNTVYSTGIVNIIWMLPNQESFVITAIHGLIHIQYPRGSCFLFISNCLRFYEFIIIWFEAQKFGKYSKVPRMCHPWWKHITPMNNLMMNQCPMQTHLMNILWIYKFDPISSGYFIKIQFSNGLNQTLQAKTNSQLNDLIRGNRIKFHVFPQ